MTEAPRWYPLDFNHIFKINLNPDGFDHVEIPSRRRGLVVHYKGQPVGLIVVGSPVDTSPKLGSPVDTAATGQLSEPLGRYGIID
jgi:hypothetical protein